VITDAGDQQFKRQKRASDLKGAIYQEPSSVQGKLATQGQVNTLLDVQGGVEYPFPHELNCQLFAALQQTRDTREKGFLPKAQLGGLVNPDSVFRELSKSLSQTLGKPHIKKCADNVCIEKEVILDSGEKKIKSFRKIFALLVLVEKSSSIGLFLDEDVSDLDLPLATIKIGGLIELRRKNASGGPSSVPLNCFSQWSPVRKKDFEEYQWTMLAPFFTQGEYNDVKHYVLKDQHILPFVLTDGQEDDNDEHHGGFGKVFMVHIHADHHNFRAPMHYERGFAIKQLLQRDRSLFRKEVDVLKKFAGKNSHRHVVSLLSTYEQFNKFNLIFYRAEGNLFNYWENINPSPEFAYSNVLWMAEQCAGIAHGLLKLHRHYTIVAADDILDHEEEEEFKRGSTGEKQVRVADPILQMEPKNSEQSNGKHVEVTCANSERQASPLRQQSNERDALLVHEPFSDKTVRQWGRHGDLKPENILLYCDSKDEYGTLKISDFGEAELNSRMSKSKRRSRLANTMTYRPPECDLQPKIIRQSYDIWCLGCVYMEFVTWMLGGLKLWKEFAKERLTWDVFQSSKTDTFFEIVKNDEDEARVMVKEAVTKVSMQLVGEAPSKESDLTYFSLVLRQITFTSKLHRIFS
jgi:serine/threonine protein kinase